MSPDIAGSGFGSLFAAPNRRLRPGPDRKRPSRARCQCKGVIERHPGPVGKRFKASPGNHGAIVGTIFRRRNSERPGGAFAGIFEGLPNRLIGRDPAGGYQSVFAAPCV